MSERAVQPEVATPKAPYSPVFVSGDHVYTAGQVAFDENGARRTGVARRPGALDNLSSCLEAAARLDDVVKVNAYLIDLADFEGYNDVYREYFTCHPARRPSGGSPARPARRDRGGRAAGRRDA